MREYRALSMNEQIKLQQELGDAKQRLSIANIRAIEAEAVRDFVRSVTRTEMSQFAEELLRRSRLHLQRLERN